MPSSWQHFLYYIPFLKQKLSCLDGNIKQANLYMYLLLPNFNIHLLCPAHSKRFGRNILRNRRARGGKRPCPYMNRCHKICIAPDECMLINRCSGAYFFRQSLPLPFRIRNSRFSLNRNRRSKSGAAVSCHRPRRIFTSTKFPILISLCRQVSGRKWTNGPILLLSPNSHRMHIHGLNDYHHRKSHR